MLLAGSMLLCACGGGSSQAKEIDLDALAAELTDSGAFTDLLSQPADGVAARLYSFEDGDNIRFADKEYHNAEHRYLKDADDMYAQYVLDSDGNITQTLAEGATVEWQKGCKPAK